MVDMLDVMLSLLQQKFEQPSENMQVTTQLKKQLAELGVFDVPAEGTDIISFGTSNKQSMRVFLSEEIDKINTQTRSFILFLHRSNILTEKQREVVIESLMQLRVDEVDVNHLMAAVAVQLIFEPEKLYALIMAQHLLQSQSMSLH